MRTPPQVPKLPFRFHRGQSIMLVVVAGKKRARNILPTTPREVPTYPGISKSAKMPSHYSITRFNTSSLTTRMTIGVSQSHDM
ncbi:hypothetical protein LY76DRAFT_409488 [Colletotrichum caudatum]|nr:hypothetical protein LY76DRAFT_409488 [Colletotrichum caudatum]